MQKGATTMNPETIAMVARVEQTERMAQAAKYNRMFEAGQAQRGNRAGLFSRHTRNTK